MEFSALTDASGSSHRRVWDSVRGQLIGGVFVSILDIRRGNAAKNPPMEHPAKPMPTYTTSGALSSIGGSNPKVPRATEQREDCHILHAGTSLLEIARTVTP